MVEQATRAPSVNNTQPWRFQWDGQRFTLAADLERGLVISDPEGRELIISCGAALLNLRLALRQIGRQGVVHPFPDQHDPRVLASVEVTEGPPMTELEQRWCGAIPRRHTHRGAFEDKPISPALAVDLQEAAETQGATLLYVKDVGPRRRILHLARTAERLRSADPEARTEAADWTPPPGTARRDGVPAQAYSPGAPASAPDDLPGRTFDLDREFGRLEDASQPPSAIAALITNEDLAPDWLTAGQALEAILLAAATEQASAVIHSRITEVPNLRAELRRELATAAHPQLLLRFGYTDHAATTPRRPAVEVLDITT
jgi:hypothetical protein